MSNTDKKTAEELATELIQNLDEIATEYDHYEYGLPTTNEDVMPKMIQAVFQFQQATPPQTGVEILQRRIAELNTYLDEPINPDLFGKISYAVSALEKALQEIESSIPVTHSPGVDVGKVVEVIKDRIEYIKMCGTRNEHNIARKEELYHILDLIQALPVKSGDGWISVDEQLPDESNRYWCYVKEINDLGIGHYEWNYSYDAASKTFNANPDTVTHWRSLMGKPIPSPHKI